MQKNTRLFPGDTVPQISATFNNHINKWKFLYCQIYFILGQWPVLWTSQSALQFTEYTSGSIKHYFDFAVQKIILIFLEFIMATR